MALLVFLASGAVVVLAGTALTGAADAIAERTGIGRLWVGAVLLAAATSLPELTTDIAAVRLGAPDLAAGDLFGSSMANMGILAVLGLVRPRGRIFREVTLDHALTAALAVVLNSVAAVLVIARPEGVILGVSPWTLLLPVGFAAGMRAIFRQGVRSAALAPPSPPAHAPGGLTLGAAVLRFALACAVILAAAPAFAAAAQGIAEQSGLGSTFVGTFLVGLSTSLPEVVSSVAALRLGALDLAVGNLFGSNAFNMTVFAALDVAHPSGSIFAAISTDHALSALLATVMMALGLAAIAYRADRRYALLEPGSGLMLLVYWVGVWALYRQAVP